MPSVVFWAGAAVGSVRKCIRELVRKSETMPRDGQRALRCSLLTITGVTVSGEKPEGSVGIAHPLQRGSTQMGTGRTGHRVR